MYEQELRAAEQMATGGMHRVAAEGASVPVEIARAAGAVAQHAFLAGGNCAWCRSRMTMRMAFFLRWNWHRYRKNLPGLRLAWDCTPAFTERTRQTRMRSSRFMARAPPGRACNRLASSSSQMAWEAPGLDMRPAVWQSPHSAPSWCLLWRMARKVCVPVSSKRAC